MVHDSLIRLNKHLAHQTGMSRREADEAITAGRVHINGQPARLGSVIHPESDNITVDNAPMSTRAKYTYLLLNKPIGYVCSRRQQGDAPTVYELLPRQYHHLKVAGRLDKDSCGLILLTDDGDTIFHLTHPKFGKEKVYIVTLDQPLKPADSKKIAAGVELEDGVSKLQVTDRSTQKPNTYTVTMHEGRNRQIRRTFKHLGYTVTYLERVTLGVLHLADLPPKKYSETSKPILPAQDQEAG